MRENILNIEGNIYQIKFTDGSETIYYDSVSEIITAIADLRSQEKITLKEMLKFIRQLMKHDPKETNRFFLEKEESGSFKDFSQEETCGYFLVDTNQIPFGVIVIINSKFLAITEPFHSKSKALKILSALKNKFELTEEKISYIKKDIQECKEIPERINLN